MTVANELSGDIAGALLTIKERSQLPLSQLKEIVLAVHSTLQDLDKETRTYSRRAILRSEFANRSTPHLIEKTNS